MKLKRIGIILLALLLVLAVLSSCETLSGSQETGENGGNAENSKIQVEKLELIKDGKSDYKIVYPVSAKGAEKTIAKQLQTAIKQITGVELRVISDLEFEDEPHTMRQEKEILIGETNRSNEYTVPQEANDMALGCTVFVAYERIVLLANSNRGMLEALRRIVLDQFGYDLNDYGRDVSKLPENVVTQDVIVPHTYLKKVTIGSDYFSGVNAKLSDFTVYSDGTMLQNRVAYRMIDAIKAGTGTMLSVSYQRDESDAQIVMQNDNTLKKGNWKISGSGKTVTVSANGYYGFYDAANYFETAVDEKGYYDVEASNAPTGSYLDRATGVYESTKYAYDQKGDVRVMFHNVLFGETASGSDVRTSYRDPLQAYMIDEYRPDVLGCQEFNRTKRGYEDDGSGGLAGLLVQLGYKEAIDPRVDNASGEWGYSGATKVEYRNASGKVIEYTFYNNTPLFYNTTTTELIQADYYWYKAQVDSENSGNCGAMDCGSKAATWGVFKDKGTGQKYIVVSTHMCTRSDGVRGKQGAEIVDLIKKLVTTYQCPVFFGGDMNGNIGDKNYDLFIGSAGYKSLQDTLVDGKNIATEYTSPLRTMHGYPDFDDNRRIMTPGSNGVGKISNSVQGKNLNSIDQIFLINDARVKVGTFGIVVDDMALSASDHLPIFVDFSFK